MIAGTILSSVVWSFWPTGMGKVSRSWKVAVGLALGIMLISAAVGFSFL